MNSIPTLSLTLFCIVIYVFQSLMKYLNTRDKGSRLLTETFDEGRRIMFSKVRKLNLNNNIQPVVIQEGGMTMIQRVIHTTTIEYKNITHRRMRHFASIVVENLNKGLNKSDAYILGGEFQQGGDSVSFIVIKRRRHYILKIGQIPQTELEIASNLHLMKKNIIPTVYNAFVFNNAYITSGQNRDNIRAIIMEYIDGVTMGDWLRSKKTFTPVLFKSLFLKLLEYYKVTQCFHGDLHIDNVFIYTNKSGNYDIKLIDFGRSIECINMNRVGEIVDVIIKNKLNYNNEAYIHESDLEKIFKGISSLSSFNKSRPMRGHELGKYYLHANYNPRMNNMEQMHKFLGYTSTGNIRKPRKAKKTIR